jgi:nicotinamide-nucleotide amidase
MNTLTFVGRDGMVFPEKEITGEIRRVFGDRLLEQGHADLESELLGRLSRKGLTISAAESCTGGLIAQRLTSVPGSSKAFLGGVVAYSNQAKISFLGVPADLIEARGAVSEETAVAMAEGARERFGSSLAVSVTGIAGPEGGSAQKPVGTVCFALAMREGTMSFTELIMGDRERIRTMSSQYALEAIRAHVKGGRWVSA